MNNSQKNKDFIEKTNQKLELINSSLLKHEKNPRDKEFLNDIFRSVRSIRNAALRAGFGRISELSFHMTGLLDRITQARMEPDADMLHVVVSARDRLQKLTGEIENSGSERSPVKDLLDRIRAIENRMIGTQNGAETEQRPLLAVDGGYAPRPEKEIDLSLLPDEVRNEEYDPELFQIFIEQTQENLSLLRSLTDGFANAPNRSRIIGMCSDLVGKLQTSANYMGYERLADFYLQWVAELEMMDVELAVGGPVSFNFMDRNIRGIAALFPRIRDVPADPSLLEKAMAPGTDPPAEIEPPGSEEKAGGQLMKDLFNDIEEEGEPFDENAEPIAALADDEPTLKMDTGPARPRETRLTRKTANGGAIDLDPSFLEEERLSDEFDEELYQIFVQQVQENLSQLRGLTDIYQETRNKSRIVDQCSNLLGKLQASANYMGYEQLAEYYLQWIAELEMAGVDISLGNTVSFSFMEERIRQVAALFPDIRIVPAKPFPRATEPLQPEAGQVAEGTDPELEQEDDFSATLKGFFGMTDEGEEDLFDADAEPFAALSDQEPSDEEEPQEDEHPADIAGAGSAPSRAAAVKAPIDDLDALFGDDEDKPEASDPKDAGPQPSPVADPSRSALLQKLSAALKSLSGEAPGIDPEAFLQGGASPDEGLDPALYERLLGALDAAGQDNAPDAAGPVAQVMDEILAGSDDAPDNAASPAPDETDSFMRRVGELVASRSSLASLYQEMTSFRHDLPDNEPKDAVKLSPLKNLIFPLNDADPSSDRVPGEITAALLKIRMVPVSRLFALFREVVDDHVTGGGKAIRLEIQGEAEIDQGMVRDLGECLRPIVDNAVAHGIESTVERRLAGKTDAGSVRLAAHHDRNYLVIEVADDGRGIDPGKIKAAALAARLYTGDELYRMTDDELTSVFLSPRFTAALSAGSEHPCGMDLVRATVDRLNGSIRIKSSAGRGTLVELRIPLRNPIFKALKFAAGAGCFAVPLCGVEEVLRLERARIMERDDEEFISLRDENIPVVTLSRLLNVEQADQRSERVSIVIISSGAGKAGLIVDSISGLEEVVIKQLAEHIRKKSGMDAGPVGYMDEISFLADMDGIMEGIPGKHLAGEKETP